MAINVESWLKRAAEFTPRGNSLTSGETLQFAISMASAFYGPGSQQVEMIKARVADIPKQKSGAYPETQPGKELFFAHCSGLSSRQLTGMKLRRRSVHHSMDF